MLRIREAKFDRERLVPLHPTTTDRLRAYAIRRDQDRPTPTSMAFFVSRTGAELTYSGILNSFVELTTSIGLRTPSMQPRMTSDTALPSKPCWTGTGPGWTSTGR